MLFYYSNAVDALSAKVDLDVPKGVWELLMAIANGLFVTENS